MKTPASLGEMEGAALHALDGIIGKVREFYFDDSTWNVRYAVVDIGSWLNSHEVLVSSKMLGKPDGANAIIPVSLTKDLVEKCPDPETDRPVSRRHEDEMRGLYGYGLFYSWGEGYIGSHNVDIPEFIKTESQRNSGDRKFDEHLRTTRDVRGNVVHAADGSVGHVRDFIIDDETWGIKDFVVDIGNIFDSKLVLIPNEWIRSIGIDEAIIEVGVEKEKIRRSPVFNYHDLEHEIGAGNATMR